MDKDSNEQKQSRTSDLQSFGSAPGPQSEATWLGTLTALGINMVSWSAKAVKVFAKSESVTKYLPAVGHGAKVAKLVDASNNAKTSAEASENQSKILTGIGASVIVTAALPVEVPAAIVVGAGIAAEQIGELAYGHYNLERARFVDAFKGTRANRVAYLLGKELAEFYEEKDGFNRDGNLLVVDGGRTGFRLDPDGRVINPEDMDWTNPKNLFGLECALRTRVKTIEGSLEKNSTWKLFGEEFDAQNIAKQELIVLY